MNSLCQASLSALRGMICGVSESYCLGAKAMISASSILLLAALPEFAQHIVEIKIGMFDSLAAARRLQGLPIREYFGYPKVVAVWIAAFLVARFWANGGSVRAAVSVPLKVLGKVAVGLIAIVVGGIIIVKLFVSISPNLSIAASLSSGILQAMGFLWLVGVWLDQAPISLKEAFTSRAPHALVLLIIFLFSVPLTQGVHLVIHKIVLGQPPIAVWGLMIVDAFIVVPFIAALNGSALFVGYRSGATWTGWVGGRPSAFSLTTIGCFASASASEHR